VLFAAVVGGLRVAGERRVCRALWLRPLVLAGAVALGGVTGAGIAYGLLGFSESRLRALTTANGAYLKATGEWAPSLEGLTPQYIPKIPMPPWYLADHRRVQYGHLPGSTHYWLNWGGWQVCQSAPVGGGAVETEVFRYAPAEYGHGHSAEGLR